MAELRVTMNTGAEAVLDERVVEEFRASLGGQLLRSGNDGYDEPRKVWNGMIDRRPALIVRCAGVADVINCIRPGFSSIGSRVSFRRSAMRRSTPWCTTARVAPHRCAMW
jgi:hypothetical protein